MDAPPNKEDSSAFIDISRFLQRFGIPVPAVLHAKLEMGYLLLEDFGDCTFLAAINHQENAGQENAGQENAGCPQLQDAVHGNIDTMYKAAISTLLDIQSTPMDGSSIAHLRFFDATMLRQELALFTDWYIAKIQKRSISSADRQQFDSVFSLLLADLLQQPVVFVHRDYHSRNLMWHQGGVGVLDFQDAVVGPITYDLASLLRDCYVAWDAAFRERVMAFWLDGARQRLGYAPQNWQAFQKAFDWMALQRNLKAIGIFARLSCRDGKHGYLQDIPRTMGYVRETVLRYPELAMLGRLLDRYVQIP